MKDRIDLLFCELTTIINAKLIKMRKKHLVIILSFFVFVMLLNSCKKDNETKIAIIVDHTCINLNKIPLDWINKAKANLHIAYGHTSHGSQLITGMNALESALGDPYLWNNGELEGALDIRDGYLPGDLGSSGDLTWAEATRTYLGDFRNADINVIIWSWGDGVSANSAENIDVYLNEMNKLESEYPNVKFVYMTGHLDGTGLEGNLHLRNERIRKYCKDNNKILYDFADIESYDPDGNYYGDRFATDGCNYDFNNDGQTDQTGDPAQPINGDRNWAIDWQNAHVEEVDWFNCDPSHTQPLNANMKAYAAWWLWSRLAGWSGN